MTYKKTTLRLKSEHVNMLRALGFNISKLVDEILEYAIIDNLDELKKRLKKEIELKIKKETPTDIISKKRIEDI